MMALSARSAGSWSGEPGSARSRNSASGMLIEPGTFPVASSSAGSRTSITTASPSSISALASSASMGSTPLGMSEKPRSAPLGCRCDHAFFLEKALQLPRLEHLADDIGAAHELALHIELRDCRPIRECLYALPKLIGFQHVHARVGYPQIVQNLHDLAREAA